MGIVYVAFDFIDPYSFIFSSATEDMLPPFLMTDLFPSDVDTNEIIGGIVSTVQLNDASEMSLLPTLSCALVSRKCIPSVILLIWSGLSHVINFDLSKLHSKWLRPTPLAVPDNSNFAVVDEVLPSVTESIEVSGSIVSTVQLKDEGEISLFPTLS